MAIRQIQFIDLANAPEATDDELYRQFLLSRDRGTLAVLYRRHIPVIFGICRLQFQDKDQARDASLAIFDYIHNHAPNAVGLPFRVMLYTVSQGICEDRKNGTPFEWHTPSSEEIESLQKSHPMDTEADPQSYLKENGNHLAEMEKKCLELFYVKRKTYSEIGQQLRIAAQAVKHHIRKAKETLKAKK